MKKERYPESYQIIGRGRENNGVAYIPEMETSEEALSVAKQLRAIARVFVVRSKFLPSKDEAQVTWFKRGDDPSNETCLICKKHVSKHFGMAEYRCYPATEAK